MAFAGWRLADESPSSPDVKTVAAKPAEKAARPTRTERRYGTPERAKQQLRAIQAAGSPQERMRATIALVNSLPVEELGRWLEQRWFETRGGFELTLFSKLAKERWEREDPEGYLRWSLKEGSGGASLLVSWAENDPRRLLDFFKENPNDIQELQALARIAKSDPSLALARFREMATGLTQHSLSNHYGSELLQQLAREAPAMLEGELASLPDHLRFQAEAALSGERLKASFGDEIRKLWERPDGWKILQSIDVGDHADKLLEELAHLPASWKNRISSTAYRFTNGDNAAKWLEADLEGSGFSAEQARGIRGSAIQELGTRAPEDSLKAMRGMELEDHVRQNVIRNAFASNPDKVDALMALLDSEADREIARKIIESGNAAADRPPAAKVETPAQWLEQAGSMSPNSGDSYQFLLMLRNWDQEKIAELSGGFQHLPDESKRQVADLLVKNPFGIYMDDSLQGEAIRYLVSNPTDGADTGQADREVTRSASVHAVRWAAKDPAAASQWTDSLPEGDVKMWARKNLAATWSQYDPGAASQWIDSLPAEARKEVNQFIADGGPARH